MTSLSPRKFQRQYDLDLIIASRASLTVGDMVWDAVGIIPPKLDRPGAPRNVFNALEVMGEIDAEEREQLQAQAASAVLRPAGFGNIGVHVNGEHAGDFEYPLIVNVTTKIAVEKISSFNFHDLQVREMSNDLRVRTDRLLERVKRRDWNKYGMSIRRSFIITELYYGAISVSLDRTIASDVDAKVLTSFGFALSSHDVSRRVETYTINVADVPFAMRTELARRFAA